jgi:dUTP pyrophosphatase|nr:MAG TPA: dUTPase [Myoviridae sp. ctTS62]
MQMLPQHQVALAAILTLYSAGKEKQEPEVKFDKNTFNFTVNGKFFDHLAYKFDSIVNIGDVHLLQKAKIQLDQNPLYYVVGDKVRCSGSLEANSLDTLAGFAFQNLACFKTVEQAEEALALAKRLYNTLFPVNRNKDHVTIKMIKDHPDAKEPRCAYNGTSAAFDIAAVETIEILPGNDAVVPVGVRFSIPEDQPYYMQIHLRSSFGFKKSLLLHSGIVDGGYTGDFGVKVMNHTKYPVTIAKGEYFAQVVVHKKPQIFFEELNPSQWAKYEESQQRGSGGFGSSGK